jgi:hypothetical protein
MTDRNEADRNDELLGSRLGISGFFGRLGISRLFFSWLGGF